MNKSIVSLLVCLTIVSNLFAQDPLRFHNEVNELIAADSAVVKKNLILFTGSSSIRFWKSLNADFPKYNVLNRGFGGSTTNDLLFFIDTLITPYQPRKVFIYEGDNDLGNGQEPDEVLSAAIKLTRKIKDKLPSTEVLFICPKPSIARWELKDKYELFNSKLKSWCATQKGVVFIDVWTPMLDSTGNVRKDIFIEDGLHMNAIGYEIWKNIIAPYLKK